MCKFLSSNRKGAYAKSRRLGAITLIYAALSAVAAPAFAQAPTLQAPSSTLKPSAQQGGTKLSAPAPAGTGLNAPTAAPNPAPRPTGSTTPATSNNDDNADPKNSRILSNSEALNPALKLAAAKIMFSAQAKKMSGADGSAAAASDASIQKLQAGDSVKLSLTTPRAAWATLEVARPDAIDFMKGELIFDPAVTKVNNFQGNPSCNFTAPSEGFYMVDVSLDRITATEITTWTKPVEAQDSRFQSVTQQISGSEIRLLVSIRAGKRPQYSMLQTVQIFGNGIFRFKSCEITRLK